MKVIACTLYSDKLPAECLLLGLSRDGLNCATLDAYDVSRHEGDCLYIVQ